jgi:probable rRNA maturation factor
MPKDVVRHPLVQRIVEAYERYETAATTHCPLQRTLATMVELDLQLATDAPAPSEAQFRQWCELALRQRTADSELTIRLVDEPEGRELNHTWRQKDYATNVLSFPADVPDELLDIPLLGDLVICVAVVEREAAEQGKEALRPIGPIWSSTAACISLGYDHIDDDEAEEMEALERTLLAELGHPRPVRRRRKPNQHSTVTTKGFRVNRYERRPIEQRAEVMAG